MAEMSGEVSIEVVIALPARQEVRRVSVPVGTSLRDAVERSGLAEVFPELDLPTCSLGIFGKRVGDADARTVQSGDRVEVYRPLIADPKQARKQRAERAKFDRR